MARLYGQQQNIAANQQAQLFQAAQRAAEVQAQQQFRQAENQQQRDWRLGELQQQHDFRLSELDTADQIAGNRFDRQQQSIWETQSVGEAEKALKDTLSTIDANRSQIGSKTDSDEFDAILAAFNGVRSNRAITSSPKAYGEALSKIQARLDASTITQNMRPPPSIAERIKNGDGIYIDKENGVAWTQENRNGVPIFRPHEMPDKNAAIKKFVSDNLKNFDGDLEATLNAYERTVGLPQRIDAAIARREAIAAYERGDPAAAEMLASGAFEVPPSPVAAGPRRVTPKTAKTFDEYWGAIDDKQRLDLYNDAAVRLKPKDSLEGPPTPEAIMANVRETINVIRGFDDDAAGPHERWERYRRDNPENAAALEQWAKQSEAARRQASQLPVVRPANEGQLKELLAANPQGVIYIDPRDGKRKFISADMLSQPRGSQ